MRLWRRTLTSRVRVCCPTIRRSPTITRNILKNYFFLKKLSSLTGFQELLPPHCFAPSPKAFLIDQCPRNSPASIPAFASIMLPKSFFYIITAANIIGIMFLASYNIYIVTHLLCQLILKDSPPEADAPLAQNPHKQSQSLLSYH